MEVCLHQKRDGIEIMVESLFRDGTAYWVLIMNGTNKYVTETSETISVENMLSTELQGNLWRRQSHDQSLFWTRSPISIPVRERKWIDTNPERFCQDCSALAKLMIRLLRHHPSIPRIDPALFNEGFFALSKLLIRLLRHERSISREDDDGAVRFDDIMEEFKAKFDGISLWSIDDWISFLAN